MVAAIVLEHVLLLVRFLAAVGARLDDPAVALNDPGSFVVTNLPAWARLAEPRTRYHRGRFRFVCGDR